MRTLSFEYNGRELTFETEDSLFSPGQIDKGTRAMLSEVVFEPGMKVLDLGCGYGVVGACAASVVGLENVVMTDVNEKAVELAGRNISSNFGGNQIPADPADADNEAGEPTGISDKEEKDSRDITKHIFVSNGLKNISDRDFDIILSNPPYHTDFSVAKEFIEDGYKALKPGGKMVMVTKRRTWYENKLKTVFGGVKVFEKDDYFVFISEKRLKKAAPEKTGKGEMSKKLQRKMRNRGKSKHIHS